MKTPRRKQTVSSAVILRERVSPAPICSPIGVIAISAPRLNSVIPMISTTEDSRKTVSSRAVRLTSGVRYRMHTSATTGVTEKRDSLNFVRMILCSDTLAGKTVLLIVV